MKNTQGFTAEEQRKILEPIPATERQALEQALFMLKEIADGGSFSSLKFFQKVIDFENVLADKVVRADELGPSHRPLLHTHDTGRPSDGTCPACGHV